MDGIEYIARILKQEGVEWISCYPSNPLIEAVAKEGIRPIAFRHERGAVMAADGFSRTSNRQRFGRRGDSGTGRCRKRNGWHCPGLCRQRPNFGPPRRRKTQSNRSPSQFFRNPHLSRMGQTRRGNLSTRRCRHRDAPRIPRTSQWYFGSSRSRNDLRRLCRGSTRRRTKLPLAKTHATNALVRRHKRCRHSTARSKKPCNLGGTRGRICRCNR